MPSEVLVRTCVSFVPMSVRVRLAPGTTSPCGSVTTPWMEARYCANAVELRHKDITANAQIARTLEILLFILPPKKLLISTTRCTTYLARCVLCSQSFAYEGQSIAWTTHSRQLLRRLSRTIFSAVQLRCLWQTHSCDVTQQAANGSPRIS